MRGGPVFLGVYAKATELEKGGEKNATRWSAWGLAGGGFMLQEANNDNSAGAGAPKSKDAPEQGEPRRLSPDEFFLEYRVLAAFSQQEKARKPHPEAPIIADYAQCVGPGAAPPRESDESGDSELDEAPWSEPAGRSQGGYNNLWMRRSESAGDSFKPTGSAASSWMPPAEDGGQGVAIVKNREEAARHVSWKLPRTEAKPATVINKGGLSDKQAYVEEILEEPNGPREMPRAEIESIEESFRTEFSLALIRLKGKREEGIAALEKMVGHPGPFAVEHKFMFTDCGLALRKRNFYAMASKYHERARKLSPDDEHVLFNQARVMYESGRIDKARAFLQLALDMVPAFGEAKDFLAFIDRPNKR